MKIIKGNKKIESTKTELDALIRAHTKVILDIGTGDGRYVFKNALSHQDFYYIGVDPSEKSLEEYSKKAVKSKTNNVLFVVGSLELLPAELIGIADEVTINLPWGSLLQLLVQPTNETAIFLRSLFKKGGTLNMIFGYDPSLEPGETKRLNLNPINTAHVKTAIIPVFEQNGFALDTFETITSGQLKKVESTWGKKISFRSDRPLFHLKFTI